MWGSIDVPYLNTGCYICKQKFNRFEVESYKKNIFDVKKNSSLLGFTGKNQV